MVIFSKDYYLSLMFVLIDKNCMTLCVTLYTLLFQANDYFNTHQIIEVASNCPIMDTGYIALSLSLNNLLCFITCDLAVMLSNLTSESAFYCSHVTNEFCKVLL